MEGLIQKLMAPMLLAMYAGLYWLWSNELLVTPLAIGLALSHVICTIIFHHFVYVFNYGYATTMIILPIVYGLWYQPSFPALIVTTVLILYGLRLMSFSWLRYRTASFAERTQGAAAASKAIPLPIKFITWLFTGSFLFYVSFNVWVVTSSTSIGPMIWLAVSLMVIGLALETIADDQKQRAKNVDKDAFCYTGLYRKIRHPNFLGEILFHIGLYCTMVAATGQFYTLIIGAYGTGWLLMLMSNEAVLNDRKQQARYGDTQRYAEYRRSTGLLWPRLF